ncbi:MAG: class I SAM-dependent methyltransferase [Actinomycetota bacterium]|nr:class I SAM-dependent methyltransferase [Actinomycetota bacterium]
MEESVEGARSFLTSGDAYDTFMGRYSRPLAAAFADAAGVSPGHRTLDVGCGPGALTGVLVSRVGAERVSAFDPSPPFVAECAARHPGVEVLLGRAEQIPFGEATFDSALAQLVLHFVTDPAQAAGEMRRVVRPGGVVAACVWDFDQGMEMLRHFWDSATAIQPDAPDEARTLRFGREGEIAELFEAAGFDGVGETTLQVSSTYASFDELWSGFLAGIGPAGSFCVALPDDQRENLRSDLFGRLGSPSGPFALAATARCASGTVPS